MQTYKLAVGSSKKLNGLYFRVVVRAGAKIDHVTPR
jgi:hypothetical protein